jgi:hypothetical protein
MPRRRARHNAGLVLPAVRAILLAVFGLRFITSGLTSGAAKDQAFLNSPGTS